MKSNEIDAIEEQNLSAESDSNLKKVNSNFSIFSPLQILVAEDNPIDLEVMKKQMTNQQIIDQCDFFVDGLKAFTKAKQLI